MIHALTCLLFPFAANCSTLVRDVPTVAQVVARETFYSGKEIIVTGRVSRLDQWKSPVDGDEQTFLLCDHGCIRVYMRARSPIQNGALVTVSGQYYAAFHEYRHTYYNELEAQELLPRE